MLKVVKNNINFVILLFLFLIALAPRLYRFSETEIYPDEITWTVRGKETFYAIKNLNFAYFQNAWWNNKNDTEAIALPLLYLIGPATALLGINQGKFSLNLLPEIYAARIPVIFLNSLFIPIFYLISKKIVKPKIAFVASLMLALDPTHLALSRWTMLDGPLTLFSFLAVALFLFFDKFPLSHLLAALSLSAAFLTKPNGLIPAISWLVFTLFRKTKTSIGYFIFSISIFTLLTTVLWPGSWQKPIISIFEYLVNQTRLTGIGIPNYFLGQVTINPPPYYYLFQIAAKLPLLILIYLILFIFLVFSTFLKSKRSFDWFTARKIIISVTVYVLTFLIIISFSPKKLGVRYALPLWPWIYLAAGSFFYQQFNLLKSRLAKIMFTLLTFIPLVANILTYFPNYYLFYNSLIGGPAGAQKYDLLGLCQGIKDSLSYVKNYYPDEKSVAILGCGKSIAAYYSPIKVTTNWEKEKITIVENSFQTLLPNEDVIKHFKSLSPIYEVALKGAVLARIYENSQFSE